ncbi:putative bifunctional diguanylate cyclase/phosphodiesterase [Deinococcus hopiensis]|uniref:Diguanylate cyclase (GGDEF) domain-containing protein n=1 Tax=Deinococcus hopiensis KR-140 TaxID=695939 RepID=A0A1W1VV27_9DEIO|nr:EAL domain-containing protein [Deinococcus hopiensis]SMB97242.1 diguanylate cyclase (GGDEF) domain-containing protein [Deinococcus hopiensis KR-140]
MTLTDEEARLAELHRFGILDTLPEPQFDRIVALAARYLNMPMAAVSLVDRDRQWFKSRLGIEVTETPISESICAIAIQQDKVLVIPDARQDPRVNSMNCVSVDETVGFYAGAPLRTSDGYRLGTVCVIDAVPRTFTRDEEGILEDFAELVMDELRLHVTLQQLGDLALLDSLTGLPNRANFRQRLTQAMRRAELTGHKVVLGLMDLDRFKLINDTLGHAAGDELLRLTATRLRECVASSDTVARMGGDEFALLFTDIPDATHSGRILERIRHAFAAPFSLAGQELFVHWSLGLSVYPDDASGTETLLSQADTAMYRAKRAGGGHTFFNVLRDQHTSAEMEMLTGLHHALERGEFQLYYQPIVDARSRTTAAHEALIRWLRPDGLVNPMAFIPLAEASGLILPLGRWVLREACTAVARRHLKRVSVNVSPLEFGQPDFAAHVEQIIQETGVEPRRVLLEVTENSLLDPVRSSEVLQALSGLGLRLALDDFGTGYSSLSALAGLPVEILKIDRSFTRQVHEQSREGQRAKELVRAMIALAHAFGLTTVAEGVETAEQAEVLEALGCTYLQGYWFGRPTPLRARDAAAP